MLTRNRLALAALLVICSQVRGEGIGGGGVGGSFGGIGPGVGDPSGIASGKIHLTPPTACLAGQLDFSLATGCNTTLYMVILK